MIKTTLHTTGIILFPKFIRTIITMLFFGIFFCFIPSEGSSNIEENVSLFYENWDRIKTDLLSGVEQMVGPDPTKDTHTLGVHFARRATPCVDLIALITTPEADVGVNVVLAFAERTVNSINDWKFTLPIEHQQILEPVFQNIHATALELRDLCSNFMNGHSDLLQQGLFLEIHRLVKDIFTGYCTIFNHLAGNWDTLLSQFQDTLYERAQEQAFATATNSVQSYISMETLLQDNRDDFFHEIFRRYILNPR